MSADDLSTENTRLREQIAETIRLLSDQERLSAEQARRLEQLVAASQAQTSILRATIDGIADAVLVSDEHGTFTHANTAAGPFLQLTGSGTGAASPDWRRMPGLFQADGITPYPPEDLPLARALRGESVEGEELFMRYEQMAEGMWLFCSSRPIYTEDGVFRGAVTILRDISERKRYDREIEQLLVREKEKNDLLERMRGAVEQLSTPILEVWDDVLAVPVIGVVDSTRASEMMVRVLEAVERQQCRFLIIDITGVDLVDTATADRFIKLVTAVEILGARCFITGARALVAQALVSIGADLQGLTTLRTMKHALSECIRLTQQAAPRPQLAGSSLEGRQSRG